MSEMKPRTNDDQISYGLIITVFQDVIKKWLLIVSVTLMVAMGSYVLTDYTYTPIYKTTTTFVTSSGSTTSTTFQNLTAANSLASVFSELINSSLFKNKVLEASGMPYFNGTIQSSVIPDTNLLTMTVSSSDPRSAFLMAKGIIEHHDSISSSALGNVVLEVLQNPVVPVSPSNPLSLQRSVLKASSIAFALMCVLMAALSFSSDKIRSKSEADQKLDCHILGELHHENKYKTLKEMLRRKKTGILITDPRTSFMYTESMTRLSSRILRHMKKNEKIMMVSSFHENEGKSTVAVNLAVSFVRRGKKVLLIDCDLRKPSCSLILNQRKLAVSLIDVLTNKAALSDALVFQKSTGLHLLTSIKGLRTATNLIGSGRLKEILIELANEFDLILVDTPPMSAAPDAEVLSEFCDVSLLVVRQNEADAKELNAVIQILNKSKSRLLGCVLNNMYGSTSFSPAFQAKYGRYGKYGRYSKYGYYGNYGSKSHMTEKRDEA